MRLLDRPPHEVWVTPKVRTVDKYGEAVYVDGDRVGPIPCAVQPFTSGQNNVTGVKIEKYGTQVKVGYNVYALEWPGGPSSTVEWQGRKYQQDGEAQVYSMSANTAHVKVGIIAQDVEMY